MTFIVRYYHNHCPHFINNIFCLQGVPEIPSRNVGYVLRILGQNPTEDDIVEMVMKVDTEIVDEDISKAIVQAGCDWEGVMSRNEFIAVGIDILKSSCDHMDDIKSAFRVFDYNNERVLRDFLQLR